MSSTSLKLGSAAPEPAAPEQHAAIATPVRVGAERVVGSYAIPQRGDLLSHVEVNHGPADVLGRFFLWADDAARAQGVSFSIATFQDLIQVNAANRASWPAVSTLFDPAFCPQQLLPENSYAIFGRNSAGDVVSCSGAKMLDLGDRSLFEALASLDVFFDNPTRDALPDEHAVSTAPMIHNIRGRVFIGGVAWVRPDYRGRGLPGLSVRISRAMAASKFSFDSYVSFLMDYRIQKGFDNDLGYVHAEWAFELKNSRTGSPRTKFVWLNRDEIVTDLRAELARLDSVAAPIASPGAVTDARQSA